MASALRRERGREREEELLANFMELFGQRQSGARGGGGQAAAAVATFTHSVLLGLAHISYFSTAANTPHSFEWLS